MRTDPRKMCANERENRSWAIIHHLVAHPLMALTIYSSWAVRFHDWTSLKAWPVRPKPLSSIPSYPDAGLTAQLRGNNETFSLDDMLRTDGAKHA